MKRVTIKDVAAKAGVGISVVSYVLNNTPGKTLPEETRMRVIDSANSLGYKPNYIARGMRMQRSMTIGVVSFWNINEYFFTEILAGIANAVNKYDYSVTLCAIFDKNDDFSYIEHIKNKRVDGIILICPYEKRISNFNEAAHIEQLVNTDVPFLVINGRSKFENTAYVNIDYYNIGLITASYMIKKGWNDIAFITQDNTLNLFEVSERVRGYKDALAYHGLSERIYEMKDLDTNLNSYPAVITSFSHVAQNILEKAYRFGVKVPGDVAVMAGNTDHYTQYLFPALTSVKFDCYEMGITAVDMLMSYINKEALPSVCIFEGEIVVRDTC